MNVFIGCVNKRYKTFLMKSFFGCWKSFELHSFPEKIGKNPENRDLEPGRNLDDVQKCSGLDWACIASCGKLSSGASVAWVQIRLSLGQGHN